MAQRQHQVWSESEKDTERIGAQLAHIQRLRDDGQLPYDQTPLRLYCAKNGGFIRVLDDHDEPITPAMLNAIDAFLHPNSTAKDEDTSNEKNEDIKSLISSKSDCQEVEETEAMMIDAPAEEILSRTMNSASNDEQHTSDQSILIEQSEPLLDENINPDDHARFFEVECLPREESITNMKTPEELLSRNESVSAWFASDLQDNCLDKPKSKAIALPSMSSTDMEDAIPDVDYQALCEQWPMELLNRRRICYLPSSPSRVNTPALRERAVVYWLRSTLRVSQGNFALEVAILLAQRFSVPLVTVCLIPSTIMYPICYVSTVNDAYSRWSFSEIYDHFEQVGLPFYGVTAKTEQIGVQPKQNDLLERNRLFQVLDSLSPLTVVTDEAFDLPSRKDLWTLTRDLELNSSSSAWPLFAIDSMTYVPVHRMSAALRCTLDNDTKYVSDDEFAKEYLASQHAQNESYAFTASKTVTGIKDDDAIRTKRNNQLFQVLDRLNLEQVDWQIVKSINAQTNPQMVPYSESHALQKLDMLLTEFTDRPAIQAELEGGGVLSLLPFIRHGTLFVGHVIHRITEAISSYPPPTTMPARRSLAMLKVLRSRAMNHLAKERDYALYLALWISNRYLQQQQPDMIPSSQSHILNSLNCSASCSWSSLEAYRYLLPAWVDNNTNFNVDPTTSSSVNPLLPVTPFDPYELESSRTNDLYWNDIQRFLINHQYIHPLLIIYWGYRLLEWSVSCKSAIAMIESMLCKCALGSTSSPDAVLTVWNQLFRLGKADDTDQYLSSHTKFRRFLEADIASQPRLQLK